MTANGSALAITPGCGVPCRGLGELHSRDRVEQLKIGIDAANSRCRSGMDFVMQAPEDGVLLRIFLGEDDKFEHRPLYEAIVLKAREIHLAGATVIRGPMGFGNSSLIHTTKILRLSEDLPLVVEIVDSEDKINAFLPALDRMMTGGMVTLEKVKVLKYGSR